MSKREQRRIDSEKAFIEKAKNMPCNVNVDYSMVRYINSKTPVHLYDKDKRPDGTEYGDFWQTPYNHLRGQQHPDKRGATIAKSKSLTTEEIVERFKEKHKGENLDYSKVVYRDMHTKVCIIDHDLRPDGTEWGEYWQEPVVHLKGCGHPQKGVHKRIKTDKQRPRKVSLNGRCVSPMVDSVVDELVDFVKSLGCRVVHKNCYIAGNDKVAVFMPEFKVGIEYNDLYWHSEVGATDNKIHLRETEACEKLGVRLIQIFEDEWLHGRNIVLSKIRQILGCNNGEKIMGRRCVVEEIDKETAEAFLERNHVQGFVTSTVYIGAYCDGTLVGVMTFKKENKNSINWELTRFATDIDKRCVGLGGKLFKYFLRNYEYNEIKSFADRRWTSLIGENLYTKMGFVLTSVLRPDYRYVDFTTNTRLHKFGFRKQILHKRYGLPLTMTESEMVDEIGFYRIWDCGLLKYVYRG